MFEIFSKSFFFFKSKILRKENRESYGIFEIFGGYYSFIQHGVFKFYLLFDKHVLNLPLDYNMPNTKW
jgi:hypothetical protein